jgi:hypothetical protein
MFQTLALLSFPVIFAVVAVVRRLRVRERLPTGPEIARWWRDRPPLSWGGINVALAVTLVVVAGVVHATRFRAEMVATSVAKAPLRLACRCGLVAAIPRQLVGRRVKCPQCGRFGRVPTPLERSTP